MKKLTAILLVLAFALGSLSLPAAAKSASGTWGDNLAWNLDSNGTLTISGEGEMENFDYYVANGWRKYAPHIKTVVIEDGVSSIGWAAFAGCSALVSITISDSVTSIKNLAFAACYSLAGITIPDSVTYIGSRAFEYCRGLETLAVDTGNSTYHSVDNCIIETKTRTIVAGCKNSVIPDYITSIGENAFCGCSSLKSIDIPYGVTTIGDWAFSYCSSLTSITIPESVKYIETSAFDRCSSLTSITLPDSIAYIDDQVFYGCSSLASINIPDGVTSIGYLAFGNCASLTSITIPGSVAYIGGSTFNGCYSLKLVYVKSLDAAKLLTKKSAADGLIARAETIILDGGTTATDYIKKNYPVSGSATINGESVNWYKKAEDCAVHFYEDDEDVDCNICGRARSKPAKITYKVTIADNDDGTYTVTAALPEGIHDGKIVISGSDRLDYVEGSLVSIDEGTCNPAYDDNGVKGQCVSFASSLALEEGTVVFTARYRLKGGAEITIDDITVPYWDLTDGFNKISDNTSGDVIKVFIVYYDPPEESSYEWSYDDPSEDYSYDWSYDDPSEDYSYDWSYDESWDDPQLPVEGVYGNLSWSIDENGTLTIYGKGEMEDFYYDDAWRKYSGSIESIVIKDGITSIGELAFFGCASLTSISIPNGVTSIGENAVSYCTSLTSITIPNSVTYIGDYAFSYCDDLKSITIGNSVSYIGDYAFCECSSLTDVTIPDCVTTIGESAFENCYFLTNIAIGNGVAAIGESAFHSCSKLETITVSDSNPVYHSKDNCIIETGTNTLVLGCKNSIIPDYITSIGDLAFAGCSGLTSIDIPDRVTSIGYRAFLKCYSLTNVTLPYGVVSIGQGAFEICTSLTSIDIPDSVTSIGWEAFGRCSSLESVTLSDKLTSIGDYAFEYCSPLKSIIIPKSVTYVGWDAFDSLKLVYVKSPDIAEKLEKYYITGCLIDCAETVILPSGIAATDYIKENYPVTGTTTIAGESVNWYKMSEECAVHFYEDDYDSDCNICGYTRIVEEPSEEPSEGPSEEPSSEVPSEQPSDEPSEESSEEHVHSLGGWESDKTQHWHECTVCGEKLDAADHVYDSIYDADCNICGAVREAAKPELSTGGVTASFDAGDGSHYEDAVFKAEKAESGDAFVLAESALAGAYGKFLPYVLTLTDSKGEKINVVGKLKISIPIPEGWNSEAVEVYYVSDDGVMEPMHAVLSEDGTCVEFFTTHFSVYTLVDTSSDVLLGDANGDGGVNNIDASLILQYDAGVTTLDDAALAAADTDGNSAVNNIDASRILQLDAGVISAF